LKIPFTTGLLVGIGETREERLATLEAIAARTTSSVTSKK
jgi:2-iminoacetate synthase ThiH